MPGSENKLQNTSTIQSVGIINALRRGTVPSEGLERLAVGIEREEQVLADQIRYVSAGRSDLKCIHGDFGSGKTFFVSRALEIARSDGFATAHVVLSQNTQLHKLASLYRAIAGSIRTDTHTPGLKSIIDSWIYGIEERLIGSCGDEDEEVLATHTAEEIERFLMQISEENSGLAAAVRTYYHAANRGDFTIAGAALGWISGEDTVGRTFKKEAGVRGGVDEGSALRFLKGLTRIIHQAGYRGLAVACDETETIQALSRPLRERGYVNLRQIVDAVDRNEWPGTLFLVTGTPSFFEGPKGIRSLPPLYDRIQTIRSEDDDGFSNPLQTQIILPRFDEKRLEAVATRVIQIYSEAYGEVDRSRINLRFIRAMTDRITFRFGGRIDVVPRIFLREFVDILDKCALHDAYDPLEKYRFEGAGIPDVKEEERAVMEIEW